MILGGESVSVPFVELGGDPTSYDPAYRAKVADIIASGFDEKKLPVKLQEKVTLTHAKFLKEFKSRGEVSAVFSKYPFNGLVMNIASGNNGSTTRHYLQALLLTEQPVEVIAADLQLEERVVKLYCDLYFACRSEQNGYEMILPMEARLAFAFGEVSHDTRQPPSYVFWRVLAVRNGYSTLIRHWGMESTAHGKLDDAHGAVDRNMWLAAESMEQQIRAGSVGFRSLVEMQNSWVNYHKMKNDEDGRDGTQSDSFIMLMQVLSLIAPKVMSQLPTPEQQQAEIAAADKKRLAENNIGLHNSIDGNSNKLDSEFNKIKKEKFKSIEQTQKLA